MLHYKMPKKYEIAMQSLRNNLALSISRIRSYAGEQESWPLARCQV